MYSQHGDISCDRQFVFSFSPFFRLSRGFILLSSLFLFFLLAFRNCCEENVVSFFTRKNLQFCLCFLILLLLLFFSYCGSGSSDFQCSGSTDVAFGSDGRGLVAYRQLFNGKQVVRVVCVSPFSFSPLLFPSLFLSPFDP